MEIKEYFVGLKVMRLTRPTLSGSLPITCDSKDLPGNLLNQALQQDSTSVPGAETIMCGQFLLLPQNPVGVYLGETFSSFICAYNETTSVVHNVTVKVDLQTASHRMSLAVSPPTPELPPDQTINLVIHHEVKELGNHILVCEVGYTSQNSLPVSFRKFFKIPVSKPLDVKTKFFNAENDDVFLEAQVENTTQGSICLEKVALEPSHLFTVTPLNNTPEGENVFGQTAFLQPKSSCQFLYCLTPNQNLTVDLKLLSEAVNIGKLDIVWRSNLGERGRLQTSQLQRVGPVFEDVRLSISELPNFVVVEEQFNLKFKLVSACERTIELTLFLSSSPGLAWCGVSGRKLPPLPPKSSQEIVLCAIPLQLGLQSISGINLLENAQKRSFSFDELAQVFVILNRDEAVL